MYVCATRFQTPDPDNPDYSLLEVQFYAWTPRNTQEGTEGLPDHALCLRKNLKTNRFELVREFQAPVKAKLGLLTMFTHKKSGHEEVVFVGGLHDALRAGDRDYARIFGKRGLDDGVCVHRWPYGDGSCRFPREYDDENGETAMNF